MPYSDFQRSNKKTITTGETWTSENFVSEVKLNDILGENSRLAVVTIRNPNNLRGATYSPYQRVRLLERDTGHVIFLGRIESIQQDQRKQELTLLCRDYMAELAERTNSASSYSDIRRSELVKDIINTDNQGVFGTGSAKNITSSFHVDSSVYLEQITRAYGNASDGYESLLESIEKLSAEEPWYPSIFLFWSGSFLFFTDQWFPFTAESWSSNNLLIKPQFSHTGPSGVGKLMKMYVGSTFQFSGIDFVLQADSVHSGLVIEYWDGATWTAIASAPNTPVVTDNTNDLEQSGSITWSVTPSDWTVRTLTGVESSDTIPDTSFRDDDTATTVGDSKFQNLYWVRFYVDRDENQIIPNLIYSARILDSNSRALDSRWDYRIEDPVFFDVVGDGNGAGSWTENTTNSYPPGSTNFNFLSATGRNFYFGSDRKFAGIEFELATNGDYSNVTITWEYYNGATWTTITDDNSYGFTTNGTTRFNTNAVTDWATVDLINATIEPSSVHGLFYYIRASVSGIPNTTAIIDNIRTISIGSFAFFERGTEPWPWRLEGITSSHGGAATRIVDNNAIFTADLVGNAVENIDTSASTTVSSIVNTTTMELSAGIFLTAGGENYQIVLDKDVDSIRGTKADDNQGSNWHGVTLQWRGEKADQVIPIYKYQLGESPIETYTRVVVHGKDGARGTAVDSSKESTYGIVKEKVVYDWDLQTPGVCKTKAENILKYIIFSGANSVRRGTIEIVNYPTYIYSGKPRTVRAGDIVHVTISDGSLSLTNVRFLVWSVEYNDAKSIAKLTVTQDLLPAMEKQEDIATAVKEVSKQVKNISWKESVPSGKSAKAILFHNTEGVYSPEARIIQNNQVDDNEDRLDIDNYSGGDDTNTADYAGGAGNNWATALSIFYARGGALGFTGATDAQESDINSGNGRLYYNQDDDLFKARVENDEVASGTFRWLPVGEWGRAAVTGGGGTVQVTFQSSYASKPQVLLTVDEDTSSSSGLFAEVDSWLTSGGDYTGMILKAWTAGGSSHTHDITFTRGGSEHNVQIPTGGGSLYTGQGGGGTVTAPTGSGGTGSAVAPDSTEIMFLVITSGPPVTSP